MQHQIKMLAEAITNGNVKSIIQTHVKQIAFDERNKHVVIYVNNAGPLHELSEKEGDHHLNSGLAKLYGDDITYEIKMHGEETHDRDRKPGAGWGEHEQH